VSEPASKDRGERERARPRAAGRFDRQVRFAPLGQRGQAALERSRVLLVGCGATGGVLAQSLVRAGVGELVLVDRDVVEPSNLPRQVLFFDRHAREGTPKAFAARETLSEIGGPSVITAHATQLDADNVAELAGGAALILDGTDNLATRYLLNDHCVRHGLPWIYAGVVGAAGIVLPVLPGQGPCLRCVFPDPPPPGALETCESTGVLLPAVSAVASLAAGLALRLLAREDLRPALEPALVELDVWNGGVRRIVTARDPDCPACARGELPVLESSGGRVERLCGRNTVQVRSGARRPDLASLARKLDGTVEDLVANEALLRFTVEGLRWTVFRDGRALVEGTEDLVRARTSYDRYVGS
jgi:adenylyltransferase/sulfurtransferase